MMRQMRENTKIIMLVTAAAFVALMVFEWGMDMSGQTAGAGNVGRVGSVTVSAEEYQTTRQNLYNQIQQEQDRAITSAQEREIEDMAWDEVVNRILIEKELDRRGIQVSDDEIRQAARFSPPPEIQQDPQFQTNGQFDLERWQQFLASPQADNLFLLQLEQYYREIIPRNKLVRQLTAGIYVPDSRLWRDWREENETVEARFLSLDPTERAVAEEVEVTDAEVQAYYEENRDDFAVPARIALRYVSLDKAPTAADSIAARERTEELLARLVEGEAEFDELAREESADVETAERGGELGTVAREELPRALAEYAFTAPVGEVSEPILTARGYHLLEVTSREDDQADVRQIVIPIERTEDSEIALLTQADSLETLGTRQPLAEAAQELGLSVEEGEIHEDMPYLRGVGPADEVIDWAFNEMEELEAPSPVFETQDAFYMVEVVDWTPATYLSVEDARPEIEQGLRVEKALERVEEEAREIYRELEERATLDEVAERHGLEVREPAPFTRTTFVPGLGRENAAIGKAFGTPAGEVAGPVTAANRVIILEVLDRIEPSREDWEAQKEFQRFQTIQRIEQERLDQWLDGLRETVRIQDSRAEFFREAERMEEQPQIPMAF